jgi:AraC-like DNA-binding protein
LQPRGHWVRALVRELQILAGLLDSRTPASLSPAALLHRFPRCRYPVEHAIRDRYILEVGLRCARITTRDQSLQNLCTELLAGLGSIHSYFQPPSGGIGPLPRLSRDMSSVVPVLDALKEQKGSLIEQLAFRMDCSAATVYRRFNRNFDAPPHQYLMHHRLDTALRLVEATDQKFDVIAREAGVSRASLFRAVKCRHGCTPQALRHRFAREK